MTVTTDGMWSAVSAAARPAVFCWSAVLRASWSSALTTIVPVAPALAGKYLAATCWAWTDP